MGDEMNNREAERYFCPFIRDSCKGVKCMFWFQEEKDNGYCNIPVNLSD